MQRRLAAILAADVVGYSRLMEIDETGTLNALRSHRQEVINPEVVKHNGRVVKLIGDGVLIEFVSVVEAVACAVSIQKGMRVRNKGRTTDRQVLWRIGVHLGDVIIDDDDLYGDGVNIAARLESLAPVGGICVSQQAYDQVETKLDIAFENLGEQRVKNISRPVRCYRVRLNEVTAEPSSNRSLERVLDRPAVAVLPFANLSGDPEQEYFSDGLTEDLITALALWRSFPVIARNSSFVYKGKAVDLKRVGRELGAQYILEGSIRKSGARVRITAQLIDASTGHHVWAEKFDRQIEDVFALQDEMTERIVANLEPVLGKAEVTRSRSKPPGNLDAWDLCLRARAHLHEWTNEATEKARVLFERAIALDPTYSAAFEGLAWAYSRDLLVEATRDREKTKDKMFAAAQRAVALDDDSSRAHFRLSTAYLWRNEHDLALAEGRRAVQLNPLSSDACHGLGNKLDLAGDPEGISMMKHAQRLNPQDPQRNMQLTFLARAHLNAERYLDAVRDAQAAIQRRPDYPNAHYILAIALGHLGRTEEAQKALQRCEDLQPGFLEKRANWAPYRDTERNQHLREGLLKVGLPD
jgi:adenylate cyclase